MTDALYTVTLKVVEDDAVCTIEWRVESPLLPEELTGHVSGVRSTTSMMWAGLDHANQAYFKAQRKEVSR